MPRDRDDIKQLAELNNLNSDLFTNLFLDQKSAGQAQSKASAPEGRGNFFTKIAKAILQKPENNVDPEIYDKLAVKFPGSLRKDELDGVIADFQQLNTLSKTSGGAFSRLEDRSEELKSRIDGITLNSERKAAEANTLKAEQKFLVRAAEKIKVADPLEAFGILTRERDKTDYKPSIVAAAAAAAAATKQKGEETKEPGNTSPTTVAATPPIPAVEKKGPPPIPAGVATRTPPAAPPPPVPGAQVAANANTTIPPRPINLPPPPPLPGAQVAASANTTKPPMPTQLPPPPPISASLNAEVKALGAEVKGVKEGWIEDKNGGQRPPPPPPKGPAR